MKSKHTTIETERGDIVISWISTNEHEHATADLEGNEIAQESLVTGFEWNGDSKKLFSDSEQEQIRAAMWECFSQNESV